VNLADRHRRLVQALAHRGLRVAQKGHAVLQPAVHLGGDLLELRRHRGLHVAELLADLAAELDQLLTHRG
jgi:hypothetical protein